MGALYFKDLLSQTFTVRRISLAPVLCGEMSLKARQSKARHGHRYLVYKGISVYFSLKTCKGDTPYFFTPLPFPSRKLWLFLRSWCFAFVNVYFSWTPVPWRFKWRTISYTLKKIIYLFIYDCVAQRVKRLPAMQETCVRSLGQEDPLEKEIATQSSTLAWKIPWTEKPGRLQSMGSQSRTRLSNCLLACAGSLWLRGLFSSCSERGLLWVVVCRLLIAVAYLVLEQGLSGVWASVAVALRLKSTGSVLWAHRFSCSLAREIFQDQGSNLCLQHWQTNYLPLSRQGSPAFGFLYNLLASLSIWLLKSYITWFRELRLSFL